MAVSEVLAAESHNTLTEFIHQAFMTSNHAAKTLTQSILKRMGMDDWGGAQP